VRMKFWLAVALLGVTAAGCQAPPPEAYVAGPATMAAAVPIGNNEAGEPCRYQLVAPAGAGAAWRQEAAVYCGNWDQPSGRVFELGEAADPARLRQVAVSGPWRTYVDQRFTCGPPTQTSVLGGAPTELLQCTRKAGGWPHFALAVAVGGRVFGADSVRAALPAAEATIAALGGQGAPAATSRSEAQRLIASRTGGEAFGSGDEARYFELTRLGDAYNNIDDPSNAERAYREALAIQQKVLGLDDPGLAVTMMKLAAQIAHQRNAPEADKLLDNAARLAAKSRDPLVGAQLAYYRAVTAAYEGRSAVAIQEAQRAEAAFARLAPDAVARTQRAAESRTRGVDTLVSDESPASTSERAAITGLAETMRLEASLLLQTGKTAQSSELARRAERLLAVNEVGASSTGARSLRLLASNQAIAGDYRGAAGTSAEAEQIFARVVPGERPDAINLLREGAYQLKQNRVDAALDSFRKAGRILRNPSITGGARPEYILPWLDALHTAGEQSPADRPRLDAEMFEAAQFARDNVTAQEIAQATARLAAGDPKVAEAIRAFQDKQRELDRLQSERDAAVAERALANRIAAIDARIEAAQHARDEAETVIPAAAPHYLETVEKPASESEVRAALASGEGLAFFFVSDAGSYGFLVKSGGVVAYPIPLKRAEIASVIQQLRDTTVARPGGLPTPDFAASYRLYGALFGPVEKDLDGVAKLSIAASGDLLRYPLEALVTQPGVTDANGDYRRVPFLVRRVALSYDPAPRIFVNLRHGRSGGAPRPFIGFGDFRPASQAQLAASFPPDRCSGDFRVLRGLERLPGTQTEVTAIAKNLGAGPGDIVLGEAFTKERLASPELAQYRIILLATHAFLPDSLRCLPEPAIVVSAPPRAPNANNGFLRASDVENLKLDADLVALSACSTAGSGPAVGDSLSGLARAFFRGGAHGLLVTHWDVVTGAAVPLMIGTFGVGGTMRDSALALQAAQLKMIDAAGSSGDAPIEISHPNYWAAFVLIGDGVKAGPGA
jgi:CHAT domain-containing protein